MPVVFTTSAVRLIPKDVTSDETAIRVKADILNEQHEVGLVVKKESDGNFFPVLMVRPVDLGSIAFLKSFSVKISSPLNPAPVELQPLPDRVNKSVEIPWADVISNVGQCGHFALVASFGVGLSHVSEFLKKHSIRLNGPLVSPDCAQCPNPVRVPVPLGYKSNMGAFKNGPFVKDDKTDLTIVVKGTEFHAHTVILSIEGKVIERMMETNMVEGLTGTVKVEHCGGFPVEPEDMRIFLEVYYDRAKFYGFGEDCQKVMALFRLAEYYAVADIVERCVNALQFVPIGQDNWCEAIQMGSLYSHVLPGLLERCALEMKNLPDDCWQQATRALPVTPSSWPIICGSYFSCVLQMKNLPDDYWQQAARALASNPAVLADFLRVQNRLVQ